MNGLINQVNEKIAIDCFKEESVSTDPDIILNSDEEALKIFWLC